MNRVLYLGGNGHCAARLAPARAALAGLNPGQGPLFDLVDVPYPGFEGRPRAPDLGQFLAAISAGIGEAGATPGKTILYGTNTDSCRASCVSG
jgi:hypothetical protein